MGKGDKRSKKGKINAGSYGNVRPKPERIRKQKEEAKKAAKNDD